MNQRIVLAAVEQVRYRESTSLYADIERLRDPSDGHMDDVHTIRDQVAADLVMLIVYSGRGIAYSMLTPANASAANALAISGRRGGSRGFAHELGHLMGLAHDRYAVCIADGCYEPATAYAYGYVNQRAFDEDAPRRPPAGGRSWPTTGSATVEVSTVRIWCVSRTRTRSIPIRRAIPWAWPAVSLPRGGAVPADAVRTLNRTRATVASFRTAPAVTVSFGAAAYAAAEGGDAATVTVSLSAAPERPVFVPLLSTGATGATASDYVAPTRVTFAADETVQTFTVAAVDDGDADDGETVVLEFDASLLPAGMAIDSPAAATVALADDDVTPAPSVSAVALTSDPGPDAIYALGDEIEATVRFDRSVTVSGVAAARADGGRRNAADDASGAAPAMC